MPMPEIILQYTSSQRKSNKKILNFS